MDPTRWLEALGLQQYQHAFCECNVDSAVLLELTADDLTALGVTSIGHRRKLLAAIAALRPAPQSALETTAAGPTTLARAPTAVVDAERRQVTVMFCDLVGSTALSLQLDPEDLWQVIGAYHSCVAQTIGRYDGFVAKYMGDGVLVYFGYPQAHEDDAERAARAGLALVDAVAAISTANRKLSVRIGVATGIVVVGDLIGEGSAQEQAVVGDTPNFAARLQSLAAPDTVVIAPTTRRLLGNLFEYRDLGAVELKGFTELARAYQVLHQSGIESRFEALRGWALSRLVGRDDEIELLLRRWARAKAGEGQIVLVSGEAGLGKSRITAALEERLRAEPHLRLRYFCSPYHEDSALFPFIDRLGRAAGFGRDDSPATKLEKLETVLARAAPPDEDIALFADLLTLPGSNGPPLPNLSPQQRKERTLEALIRQLENLASQQPVLMVFEDAHWIDPTSRELLDLTVKRVRNLPVLLIVTFRPEFPPPWAGQPHVTMLMLNRLDRRDRTALVTQIAGGKRLPDGLVDQIIERSDGIPLFAEELTKSVLESGLLNEQRDCYVLDRALPVFAIPMTLHDSLMARLDRLTSVRRVAQIGAAIGREFSYSLLHAVSQVPEDELQASLARLVRSQLIFQRGAPPDAVYSFKHALVQDAVHGSLLRSPRQQLHAQIAEALVTSTPELLDSQPELFAHHYAEAGLFEKSATCYGMAGRRFAARSAMPEAAAQFQKALDQLPLLPENPDRQRAELEIRSALGAVLQALKGKAAPETGDAYARARELWEQLGSPSEFLHVPFAQSVYHVFRCEIDRAQLLAVDLLRLSRERNDNAGLVLGHLAVGRTLLFAGRFASSRSHFEEGIAVYDPILHRALVHHAGVDPQITSRALLGIALFCLGFPDQALAQSEAAIFEAESLADPPSLAASLGFGARLLSLVGENSSLNATVDRLVAVTTEQGFAVWHALGTIYRGWAKVINGDVAEGTSLLRSGSIAYRATGTEASVPYHMALLAAGYEIAGQVEESLAVLDDALQVAERTGERWVRAELHRRKGHLLLRQGHTAGERFYYRAMNIAGEQGAKLLELRAAVSLARLRCDQGRRTEASDLLAPVYGCSPRVSTPPILKTRRR